ncbi:MAG TPA: epimerase, partial [Cyclobacteriaceae bacterium]|nr:epimerase [Cyclobacteriaceae bacterium]
LSKNPGMTFVYVSGAGTDSTEKGKIMWARVKGKTENKILNLGFGKAFAFRPGVMKPTPGMKNTLKLYFWLGWLYPIIKLISPGSASTLAVVGQVMINVSLNGYSKSVLEVRDINAAGEQK